MQDRPINSGLGFQQDVGDGWCITVPTDTRHDIAHTGNEPMQLHAICAPVCHVPGKVLATPESSGGNKNKKDGARKPPEWPGQPPKTQPDKHG